MYVMIVEQLVYLISVLNVNQKNITRIRRVSGYLEILDGFTKGKKAEEKNRRKN